MTSDSLDWCCEPNVACLLSAGLWSEHCCWCESQHDGGSEQGPGAVCSGVLSLWGKRMGRAVSAEDGKVERNSTDSLAARKIRLQTADLSGTWMEPFLPEAGRLRGRTQRIEDPSQHVSEPTGQTAVTHEESKIFLMNPNSLLALQNIFNEDNKTDCTSLESHIKKKNCLYACVKHKNHQRKCNVPTLGLPCPEKYRCIPTSSLLCGCLKNNLLSQLHEALQPDD